MKLNAHYFEQMQFLGLKEFADAESYFHAKLQRLGMNKMQMVSLWKEILTFQQFFSEASLAPLLDEMTLNEFETYASEQVEVARYMPPKELRFSSIRELACFEAYLKTLGKNQGDIALDFAHNSLEEIAENAPQLVEEELEISYKEINQSEAALSVKVQDVWSWKTDPENANLLIAKFPKLQLNEKLPVEEYSQLFDSLDQFTQMQIDQHIRQLLLKENTGWLQAAFDSKSPKVETLMVRMNGQNLPFKGFEISSKKEEFLKELFSLAHKEEPVSLDVCSFDDTHHYQIVSITSKGSPKLVSYQTLKAEKTTEKLLNRFLAQAHKSGPNKDKDFEKVKSKVLSQWLEPLKKQIMKDYVSHKGAEPKYISDSFYCKHRLFKSMRDALEYYQNNQEEKPNLFSFNSFWNVESKHEVLIRHDSNEVEKWQSLQAGEWSSVEIAKDSPEFILLLKKNNVLEQHPMQKQIKNRLKQEMTRSLAVEELKIIELAEF